MITVLAFYKYVTIEDPEAWKDNHLAYCKDLGIRGRILIGTEGINGSCSGSQEQMQQYMKNLKKDPHFSDITFKIEQTPHHPFRKMQVKVRKEIVVFGKDVDLNNMGQHLSPKEFLELSKDPDAIILDARNDYEAAVGKFKDAVVPPIKTFKQFPKVTKMLAGKEDKKILMYCTGGIRCEKASAYLKENGFQHVYQLKDGILNFAKECPDTIWEGKCFVFDKRLVTDVNKIDSTISECYTCGKESDNMRNCKNSTCNKLMVMCPTCEKEHNKCCSKECEKQYQQYCNQKSKHNNSSQLVA